MSVRDSAIASCARRSFQRSLILTADTMPPSGGSRRSSVPCLRSCGWSRASVLQFSWASPSRRLRRSWRPQGDGSARLLLAVPAGTANRTGVSATRCLRFATIHPHRWACCSDDPLPASTSQVLEMARSCDVLPPLTVKSGGLWSTSAAWTSSPIHPSSSTTIGWAEPVVGRQDFRGGGGPSQSAGSANKPQSH